MGTSIKDVINNVKDIYLSNSSLNTLLDFERVLDELDMYAYLNWQKGELVEGPIVEKYFVTCTFMWPYKQMPDPVAGQRLLNYGCEVKYKKSKLKYPVEVKTYEDFEDGTKYPKMATATVWLVTIVMPKRLMNDIEQGSLELESQTLDLEDIELAYEAGLDDDSLKVNDTSDTSMATQDKETEEQFDDF